MSKGGIFLLNRFFALSQIFSIIFAITSVGFFMGNLSLTSSQSPVTPPSTLVVGSGSSSLAGSAITSAPFTVNGVTFAANTPSYWSLKNGYYTITQGSAQVVATPAEVSGPLNQFKVVQPGATSPPGTAQPSFFDRALGDDPLGGFESLKGGFLSHLTSGLIWGGIAYGVVTLVGGLFGLDDNQQKALSTASGGN